MLIGTMGIVTTGAAKSENNSSLTPLIASIPAQQTPIVLAQAATTSAGVTPQPNYILKDCKETLPGLSVREAFNTISPAGNLENYLLSHDRTGTFTADRSPYKVTLLEGTAHGKLIQKASNGMAYIYEPTTEYIGKDQAVFMVDFEGRRYEIILDIHVVTYIDPGTDNPTTTCPPPKLIKVTKPVSGSSGYDFGSVSVTFADLPAGALGQTTGSSITLDTTDSNRLIASTRTVLKP